MFLHHTLKFDLRYLRAKSAYSYTPRLDGRLQRSNSHSDRKVEWLAIPTIRRRRTSGQSVCLVLQFARARPSGQKPCRYRIGLCRIPASLRLGYSVAAVQSAVHLSKRSVSPGAVLKSLSYAFSAILVSELLGGLDSRLRSIGILHLEQVCPSGKVTILLSSELESW